MNPFKWVWNILSSMFYFLFNPKELASALTDAKTQAVYHLSSLYTAVGIFTTSLVYPEWARTLAVASKATWDSAYVWMTEGPGGIAAKEAWAIAKELFFGGPVA